MHRLDLHSRANQIENIEDTLYMRFAICCLVLDSCGSQNFMVVGLFDWYKRISADTVVAFDNVVPRHVSKDSIPEEIGRVINSFNYSLGNEVNL